MACCVPGCINEDVHLTAAFPADPQIRQLWKLAIRAGTGKTLSDAVLDTARVCSSHFVSIDQDETPPVLGGYREPTLFQRKLNLIEVSCCQLCLQYGSTARMFNRKHSLEPRLPSLQALVTKYFRVRPLCYDSGDAYYCQRCVTRLEITHRFGEEIAEGTRRYEMLMRKASKISVELEVLADGADIVHDPEPDGPELVASPNENCQYEILELEDETLEIITIGVERNEQVEEEMPVPVKKFKIEHVPEIKQEPSATKRRIMRKLIKTEVAELKREPNESSGETSQIEIKTEDQTPNEPVECSRQQKVVKLEASHRDELRELIDQYPTISSKELSEELGIEQVSIVAAIEQLGRIRRYGRWMPQRLAGLEKIDRYIYSRNMRARHAESPFWEQMICSNERWVIFGRPNDQQGDDDQPAPERMKALLCMWWDQAGLIYHELLEKEQANADNRYQEQFERFKSALSERRPEESTRTVIYQCGITEQATCTTLEEILRETEWSYLKHPANSPDLDPTDYHLFKAMQSGLMNQSYTAADQIALWVQGFVEEKDSDFFLDGIKALKQRWAQVERKKGDYCGAKKSV